MSRNFSPYSLSLKSRLTLFEIYKGFDHVDRSARLAWKFKLGKNITCHYLSKGFTMLFLLTVIAILVNELLRKMIKYQVIIFRSEWGKRKLRFLGGPHVVVEHLEFLKESLGLFHFFRLKLTILQKLFKILRNPSTCVSMQAITVPWLTP